MAIGYNSRQVVVKLNVYNWLIKEKEKMGGKTHNDIITKLIKFYIQKKKEEREQNELQREMGTD